jgi:hypothetical protein
MDQLFSVLCNLCNLWMVHFAIGNSLAAHRFLPTAFLDPPAKLRTLTQPLPKGEEKPAGGTDPPSPRVSPSPRQSLLRTALSPSVQNLTAGPAAMQTYLLSTLIP